jgi:hypothetical protein
MHSSWKSRRGPWGFLANTFEGGTWGCEKIWEVWPGVMFYCIFMWNSFKDLYRGT